MKAQKVVSLFFISFLFCNLLQFSGCKVTVVPQEKHPAYLHALADLRSARWLIEHRPGDWQQTISEMNAVKEINAAINDIKKAAVDDGKDINSHPQVDENPDHIGRLHDAVEFLRKAESDVTKEEDNAAAEGLKERSARHISEAIKLTQMAMHP